MKKGNLKRAHEFILLIAEMKKPLEELKNEVYFQKGGGGF